MMKNKEYKVIVTYSVAVPVELTAQSPEEAEDMAIEEVQARFEDEFVGVEYSLDQYESHVIGDADEVS